MFDISKRELGYRKTSELKRLYNILLGIIITKSQTTSLQIGDMLLPHDTSRLENRYYLVVAGHQLAVAKAHSVRDKIVPVCGHYCMLILPPSVAGEWVLEDTVLIHSCCPLSNTQTRHLVR